MEESQKKPIMIGVIVVCFALAGGIYLKTRPNRGSSGIPDYLAKEQIWLLCRNPGCGNTYQISKKDYYQTMEELRAKNPGQFAIPAITCPKCGDPSVYEARKCEKCEEIFEPGAVPNTYEDTCPKCGYSKIKELREANAASRGARRPEPAPE